MKLIALSLASGAIALAAGLTGLAGPQPRPVPATIGSIEHPVPLGRFVVTATALPDTSGS